MAAGSLMGYVPLTCSLGLSGYRTKIISTFAVVEDMKKFQATKEYKRFNSLLILFYVYSITLLAILFLLSKLLL